MSGPFRPSEWVGIALEVDVVVVHVAPQLDRRALPAGRRTISRRDRRGAGTRPDAAPALDRVPRRPDAGDVARAASWGRCSRRVGFPPLGPIGRSEAGAEVLEPTVDLVARDDLEVLQSYRAAGELDSPPAGWRCAGGGRSPTVASTPTGRCPFRPAAGRRPDPGAAGPSDRLATMLLRRVEAQPGAARTRAAVRDTCARGRPGWRT